MIVGRLLSGSIMYCFFPWSPAGSAMLVRVPLTLTVTWPSSKATPTWFQQLKVSGREAWADAWPTLREKNGTPSGDRAINQQSFCSVSVRASQRLTMVEMR
jgi:hypothetical protein